MKLNTVKVSGIIFGVGYGITLHAVARELWDKGGISEVLNWQGEWLGLFLIMLAWILYYTIERRYEK